MEVAMKQAAAFLSDVTKKKLGVKDPEPKHPSFLPANETDAVSRFRETAELFPGQIVNHFVGAAAHLTTKAGLCRSLALNARWCGVEDVRAFFPRCYDLSEDHDETRAFERDVEETIARSALRRATASPRRPRSASRSASANTRLSAKAVLCVQTIPRATTAPRERRWTRLSALSCGTAFKKRSSLRKRKAPLASRRR